MVRAESEVGLPKGPRASASTGRPSTFTAPLADPLVALAGAALAQHDGRLDAVEVVEAERKLGAQRAEVQGVHQGVDRGRGPRPSGRGAAAPRSRAGSSWGRGPAPCRASGASAAPGHLGALAVAVALAQLAAVARRLSAQSRVGLAHRDPVQHDQAEADTAARPRAAGRSSGHAEPSYATAGRGGPISAATSTFDDLRRWRPPPRGPARVVVDARSAKASRSPARAVA